MLRDNFLKGSRKIRKKRRSHREREREEQVENFLKKETNKKKNRGWLVLMYVPSLASQIKFSKKEMTESLPISFFKNLV
jgi:hypothetical protein